jgi:hypothetical protein
MYNQNSQEQSEQLIMAAHLQIFSEKVIDLCDRESDCQLSAQDTYQKIRLLWLELKQAQPKVINYIQEK